MQMSLASATLADMQDRKTPPRKYIHRRIMVQVSIIVLVALGLGVAVVNDAITGKAGVLPLIIAATVGLLVGYVAGRMFLITWHEDTQKVIMRMDRTSIFLVVAYVAFRILSTRLLGDYFTGVALTAISFAAVDGILIGRLISVWRNVRRVLQEQGIRG